MTKDEFMQIIRECVEEYLDEGDIERDTLRKARNIDAPMGYRSRLHHDPGDEDVTPNE